MRIGVLIDSLKVGGVEKVAINQVRYLREIGQEAFLLVLRGDAGAQENIFEISNTKIPTIVLDERIPGFLKFSFRFPGFAFFSFYHISYSFILPFFVARKEFDFIVSHGSYTSFSAVAFKFINRIPFSIFFWDPIYYIVNRVYSGTFSTFLIKILSLISKVLDYLLIRFSAFILVGSEIHVGYFKKIYEHANIQLLVPGVAIGTPAKSKGGYVFALTAWKLGKHPEYMLKLAKQLPDVKFIIGGKWLDPKLLLEFKNQMAKYNLSRQFEVLGYIPEGKLRRIYSHANVLLTTNLEKGFGLPVLEASACGTTFIVPIGSGVCKLFKDGEDGFFTKEHDTRQIVKKIKILTGANNIAAQMGMNAYDRVRQGYSWEAHAKNLLKIIQSGVGN